MQRLNYAERRERMESYMDVKDVAKAVKLSVQTIRRYVLKKEIPFHKINRAVRFRPSEIESWVEGKKKLPRKGTGKACGRIV